MPHAPDHLLRMESLERRHLLAASFGGSMQLEPDPPWHLVNGHVIGTADVDGDGDRDVVARIRDELLWLEFDELIGDFTNRHAIPAHPAVQDPSGRFDILDVDGDNIDDILIRYSSLITENPYVVASVVGWFPGTGGDGGFASAKQLFVFESTVFSNPQPGDIDGDGDVDFLSTRITGDMSETVLVLNDDGQFDAPSVLFPHDSRQRVDLDNDGDLDFFDCLAACPISREFSQWRENLDGVGTVGAARVIEDQREGFRFVLPRFGRDQFVDLDADGDLDIAGGALVQEGTLTVTGPGVDGWWENLGDGNFQFNEMPLFAVPDFPSARFTTIIRDFLDVDGDGDEDVVTAWQFEDRTSRKIESQLHWQANPGDGTPFGPPTPIDIAAVSLGVIDGFDVDRDGDQDLRITYDATEVWYENVDGRGDFARRSTINGTFRFPEGPIRAADMDGDGDVDVVSEDTVNDSLQFYVHENVDGRGRFADRRVILDAMDRHLSRFIELADFDGDGDADFLVAPEGFSALGAARPLQWLENIGGSLGPVHEIGLRNFTAARSADMDADGDLDLLGSDFRTIGPATFGSIDWYENADGNGTFAAVHNVTSELPISLSSLETIDLDGDRFLDVMHQLNGGIFIYRNQRDGTFGPQQRLFAGSMAFGADLDTDGDEDIVARTASGWVWYANIDGAGSLGPSSQVPAYGDTAQPVDLDYDGDIDLVFPEEASWSENIDGRGSFSEERLIQSELSRDPRYVRSSSIVLADLDGDSDLDLVAKGERLEFSHPLSEHLVWFRNNAVRPLPGDHNGDGRINQADLDLVLLNWGREADPLPNGWFGDIPTGLISQNELDAVLLNWGTGVDNSGAAKIAGERADSSRLAATRELALEIIDGEKAPLARSIRSRF